MTGRTTQGTQALPPALRGSPLADRLRPQTIADVIGQRHLLGPGKPFDLMLRSGRLQPMILWGPPGVGKTTLARLLAQAGGHDFSMLSAVLASLADLRNLVDLAQRRAERHGHTTLFIDEIHRLNNAQQRVLLPAVKAGWITLIGATTENPSFALKSALLSRVRVYVLAPLDDAALLQLFLRAHRTALANLQFDDAAIAALIAHADGDARRCLGLLEQTGIAAEAAGLGRISAPFLNDVATARRRRFDKGGEQFYDQISALHKSIRGSNPDAALYWLCRMLDGGVDPRYLGRRMTSMAWDDIGLADPQAIRMVQNAIAAWESLGSPDGDLALAQAAIYLAVAAKSNAGAAAYSQAMAAARSTTAGAAPPSWTSSMLPSGQDLPRWYSLSTLNRDVPFSAS